MGCVCRFSGFLFCVCLFLFQTVCAQERKTTITVVDSLNIDMSNMNQTICIDDKVLLSAANDTIFAYEWIDVVTGDTISRASSVVVSPDSTHQYLLNLYYFTNELIHNGDFEDVSLPENMRVTTDYKFVATTTGWNGTKGNELWAEGTYRIGKSPRTFHPYFYRVPDHTSGRGNMMIVNGSTNETIVWKTVVNVEKGRTYAFSTWGVEVGSFNPAQFHFTINGQTLGKDFQLRDDGEADAKWEQFYELWKADADQAVISLVNLNKKKDGNDFAIDDISFASMRKESGIITVKVLPRVDLSGLNDVEKCEDENIVVSAKAKGSGTLDYVWTKDGRVLEVDGTDLDIGAAALEDSGTYTCSVTGECGTQRDTFRIDVREKLKVLKEYDTIYPCDASAVTLNANVSGYSPAYRWSVPEKSRGWKNTGTVNLHNDEIHWDRDTGLYICEISNMCGKVKVYRELKAGKKIRITDWPSDLEVCAGTDLEIEVKTDPAPASVKWSGPGIEADGDKLILSRIRESQSGVYHCSVEDTCHVKDNASLILQVLSPMTGVVVSGDTAVCENGRAVLKAVADGMGVRYHWTGPGGFSAETAEIKIEPVTADRLGTYELIVEDSCGNVKPGKVELTFLNEYDQLRMVPEESSVCLGEEVKFTVEGGKREMTYEWTGPEGKCGNTSFIQFRARQSGNYICQVRGICPGVEKQANLVVKEKLVAEAPKTYFFECEGENILMSASVITGNSPGYSWEKEGQVVGRLAEFRLTDVSRQDTGRYSCFVHSDCGDTTLYYHLQLREPLKITSHTSDKYVRKRESFSLFVNISGDSQRNISWWKDGQLISGANGNRLNAQALDKEGVCIYTCRVDGCNTDQVNIRVYVRDYQTLSRDTLVVLCEGGTYSYRVPEKPEDWCKEGNIRTYWVYNDKDTLSWGQAITLADFNRRMAGVYVFHLESDCGNETLTLQVEAAKNPRITSVICEQHGVTNGRIQVCEGEDIRLRSEAETEGLVTYEWNRDGVVIEGENSPVLELKNISVLKGGRYTCRVISAECGEDARTVVLEVNKKLQIFWEPLVEICPGEVLRLEVRADASQPSQFVWEGHSGAGWTMEEDGYTAVRQHPAAEISMDGLYHCKVTNLCGEASASFRVNIEKEIGLSGVVRRDTVCRGGAIELAVPVDDKDGLKTTWTLPDGSEQEKAVIQIADFSLADIGVYSYHITTKKACFSYNGKVELYMRPELELLKISADTAVCEGRSVDFTVMASGKDLEYEWWGPSGFRTVGNHIIISPVTAEKCGNYEVRITDVCDKTGKRGKVKLGLLKEFDNVVISGNTGICEGNDVKLAVTGASQELSYEWRLREQILGNDSTLMLEQVEKADSGRYVCRISGQCQVVEKEVVVSVYRQLSAWKSDVPVVCEKEDVVMVAHADGEQLKYRWMKKGVEKGDRTAQLIVNSVIPDDAGIYECRLNSMCGDTTLFYEMQLKEKTRIKYHSADRVICENDPYRLSVEASGMNKVYHWYCDGVLMPQNTAVVDCIAGVQADTLVYKCVVTGDCGTDSTDITIRIDKFRKIKVDVNDTLCEGSNYKYNVTAIPGGTFEDQGFHYRWTFKGEVMSEGNSSVMQFTEVRYDQAGDYYCEVSTLPGAYEERKTTVKLTLNVIRLPELKSMTSDLYVVEGKRDSIKVVTSGDDLSYSWTRDGVEIKGKDKPVLEFVPVRFEDAGKYKVTVSNRCSHVSGITDLEVWRKTIIVYPQERDDSVCLEERFTMGVEAWGESGLQYHWYLNEQALDVAPVQPLILESVKDTDEGEYLCVVSGRGGVDSCIINLKVLKLPEIYIEGKTVLCQNEIDMKQEYAGRSNESRVEYQWKTDVGEILGNNNQQKIKVQWKDGVSDTVHLTITSLKTTCSARTYREVIFHALPEVDLLVPDRVGYCTDTLKLIQGYPWGGQFYVNDLQTDVVRFTDKEKLYKVSYSYTDAKTGCRNLKSDTIQIASAPFVALTADTITTGWCKPVLFQVGEHSEGTVCWGGENGFVAEGWQMHYQAPQYTDQELKFWVELTDLYTCQAADTAIVTLLPSPQVDLLRDTVIGACNSLLLHVQYNAVLPGDIQWTPVGLLTVLDEYSAEVKELAAGKHRFFCAVTDGYGCVGKDSVNVEVMATPILQGRIVCQGDSIRIRTGDFATYSWGDGYEGEERILKTPGEYELTVADRFQCEARAIYSVRPLPEVHLVDTMIYEGQEMEYIIEDTGDFGPYDYLWQDGNKTNVYLAKNEGNYWVRVTDNAGCAGRGSAFLEVRKWYIAAPDAFLPNTQGENSRFYLKEVNFGSRFEMFVYDRWGELIFKTHEIGFRGGWDGTFKGINCQPGAYVWVAFVDGKEVGKGTLMLVR